MIPTPSRWIRHSRHWGFRLFFSLTPRRCQRPPSSDFLVFLLVHTAVHDRLVFDFPHNVLCLFIFFETDKGGVPQVTVWASSRQTLSARPVQALAKRSSQAMVSIPMNTTSSAAIQKLNGSKTIAIVVEIRTSYTITYLTWHLSQTMRVEQSRYLSS
jgi:hypothetical protein